MARRSSNSSSSSSSSARIPALLVVVLIAMLICCPVPCSAGIRGGVYYRYGGPPSPQGGQPVHAGCPGCGRAVPQPPTPVVATAQYRPADRQGRGRRLLSTE